MATEPTGTTPEPSDPVSTDTAQDADDDKASPPVEQTISVSEFNARAAKLRKDAAAAKKRADDLEAKLAQLAAQAEEKDNEKLSTEERMNKRIRKLEEERDARYKELEAKAETERVRRHKHLIRGALLEEIGKRGLYEPDLIADTLSQQMTVTDDDRVVRVRDDVESEVPAVLDEFCKARPRFVPAAASGSGSRSGGPGKQKPKSYAEMSSSELAAAVEAEMKAMSRSGQSV